ncbi:MAG: hypothetical protein JST65_03055 [Acidobacteria bacterium]|nr:hypothetical protein [Acidobacteriota bacterium]
MKIDSFSGALADLKKADRTPENALRILADKPRVSVWDMSEIVWLRNLVEGLRRDGLIEDDGKEPYPWIKYLLTDKGKARITP